MILIKIPKLIYFRASIVSTCEALDVGEQDGDLLVAVDVDLVELVGLEVAVGALLLLRDVSDHLLGHEARQHRQQQPFLSLVLLLGLETHLQGTASFQKCFSLGTFCQVLCVQAYPIHS